MSPTIQCMFLIMSVACEAMSHQVQAKSKSADLDAKTSPIKVGSLLNTYN